MERDILAIARALHDTLIDGIARLEVLAQGCAMMAYLAEQDDNQAFADIQRRLSRKHRVGILEISGQVALLKAEFGEALQTEARLY